MIEVLISAQGSGEDFGIQSTHIPDPKVRSSWTKTHANQPRNLKGSGAIITKYTKQGVCFLPIEKFHQKSDFHEHKKIFP